MSESKASGSPMHRLTPDMGLLERNLRALAANSPATAQEIAGAVGVAVDFGEAEDGGLTGVLGSGPGARRLGSARRPLAEAARLAERFDPAEAGVAVVLGFGLGHHVRLLGEKLGRAGVVVVYEPDVGLLRAVFERADFSGLFGSANVAVLTGADTGAIATTLRGAEVAVSLGVRVVEHGPSGPRLGEGARAFTEAITTAVRAVRASVVTTLMQTEASLRNGLMNLDFYASSPGIADLAGVAEGRPAVVVSAGPSLSRNIDRLAAPGVRDRVVIVAVQTVVRQLLEAGVRPHLVTALDHHEISARFYEGLRAEDVEGVTLVVEPKANPAILEAWPGAVRCVHDSTLSKVLGAGFAHDGCDLEPGATVAHMAYGLARHMGCDPVILVGQDLGFTDGQYYGAGAAIHRVWAGECNEFNTLETMEWQRIARNRGNLRPAIDHLGRPVYTDEQMSAYLVQFERMFAADAVVGRRTIDATEGGVAKRAAEPMGLAEALGEFGASSGVWEAPSALVGDEGRSLVGARVAERLEALAGEVDRVGAISREAAGLLGEMRRKHSDQARVNRLIGRVQELGKTVRGIQPAYELVQHLNQTGQFKRFRADRLLHLEASLEPMERQRRQIDRDIVNVEWIAEAASQLSGLIRRAGAAMRGEASKLTRDPEEQGRHEATAEGGDARVRVASRTRVGAVVAVDPDAGTLGTPRDLGRPLHGGRNALELTLERLLESPGLDEIVLLTECPERTARLAGAGVARAESMGRRIHIEHTEGHPLGERRGAVRAARAFASECWRGGLCGMTVWDELFDAERLAERMETLSLDAAVLVGADWALLDPALTGRLIERHREDPPRRRLVFSQAAPGLSACVLERSLAAELGASASRAGGFASIGGLLGYVPTSPVLDPVAKPGCVRVGPEHRDIGVRAIADSPWRAGVISRVLGACADGDPGRVGGALRSCVEEASAAGPGHLVLELCPGRRTGGWLARMHGEADRSAMETARAVELVEALASARPDAALTLGGVGDPLMHPGWSEVVGAAHRAGLAGVHVRTDLQCRREEALALLTSGAGVVSVDLLAESAEAYRELAGAPPFENARENLIAMLEARSAEVGGRMPRVWIVPRITRCDRVYGELETFYERWLRVAQACVIDPLPGVVEGERIAPLPEPGLLSWRRAVAECRVRSDGRVMVSAGWRGKGAVRVSGGDLVGAWGRVVSERLGPSRRRSAPARALGAAA